MGVVREHDEESLKAIFPLAQNCQTLLQEMNLVRGEAHRVYPGAVVETLLRQLTGIALEKKEDEEAEKPE